MISFKKKPDPVEPPVVLLDRPVARPEETPAARRRKSDTDGTQRRLRQTADDNKLL